ncbi:MAG: DUF1566 domain-containing protein, partial [Candidatus Electrothrix sp. MAN1_4]|nr:DUF1566 domain-containing protein [Candidatus Electrothrix sp. MAN1_4]
MKKHSFLLCCSWLCFFSASAVHSSNPTGPLNDTGITWSGNIASGNNSTCVASTEPDDENAVAAQDCSHGRDVTHNDDSDGHAGFMYTKLDSSGVPLTDQHAEYTVSPWACVKDNVTGLIWEVKTDDSGLHDKDDTYTWYNTDASGNGGDAGYNDDGENTCYAYDSGNAATFCNTQAYVQRVNATGLCGASDWRMPTHSELESLVHYGRINPVIDTGYFPNTVGSAWSDSPYISKYDSWVVDFNGGYSTNRSKYGGQAVRLIRNTQSEIDKKVVIPAISILLRRIEPVTLKLPSLNDTGTDWSGEVPSGNNKACTASTDPDSNNVVAAQDCSHGRDVTHDDDSDGHAGFSYTKLDSDGVPLSDQHADYTTSPWACVKDNVTGLIWEVKTDDGGLHDRNDTYTWYKTDTADNGEDAGLANVGNICFAYDSSDAASYCNTKAYVKRVNDAGLCGASDWRIPTHSELESLVYYGRINPAIDMNYFHDIIHPHP